MAEPRDLVRFLVNDPKLDDGAPVFSDAELDGYLELEGGNVKRAAAQAIDTIADNEALASKVIRTENQLGTDGAKVADALRKRAAALREQADAEDNAGDDGVYFEIVPTGSTGTGPELTSGTWGL